MGNISYLNTQRGDDDAESFFARHAAHGPNHIVFAIAVREDGSEEQKVFSTLTKAKAWTDRECGKHGSAVFLPYVIDMPEFGEVPANQRQ